MQTSVDTEELRRRARVHLDLVGECGPSLTAKALLQLFSVPNAAIGILTSGLKLYGVYLDQVADVPPAAVGAMVRAGGQGMELWGTALAYEGVENGNPLAMFGGWAISSSGAVLNGGADTWGLLAYGVDIPTTRIPEAEIDAGYKSRTTEMVTVSGGLRVLSAGAEVKLITETYESGVRVTVELQIEGGVGAKRLARALGLEGGIMAGGSVYWDVPDEATAARLKEALAMIVAGGRIAGPPGALLTGALLRLPRPTGGTVSTGGYVEGQGNLGPIEVEGRGERTIETEISEKESRDGAEIEGSIGLELEGEGEFDLPFLPGEVSAGGSLEARLAVRGGAPDRLEIVVRGQFEADVTIGGVEAGPGSVYEARLYVYLDPIWDAIGPDVKRLLDDPTAAGAVVREALAVGREHTTAILNVYSSTEVEGDFDAVLGGVEYQHTHEERVGGPIVLHEAGR